MENLKKLNQRIELRLFNSQIKHVDKLIQKYPDVWGSRGHFVRASVNYFLKHIESKDFKISYLE